MKWGRRFLPPQGAYRDDNGQPVVLDCVREAERRIAGNLNMSVRSPTPATYLSSCFPPHFFRYLAKKTVLELREVFLSGRTFSTIQLVVQFLPPYYQDQDTDLALYELGFRSTTVASLLHP